MVVVPQEEDDGQPAVICEAYAALWKKGAARDGELVGPAADVVPREGMPALGTDEADVVLYALTAACYDNQVRELGRDLPELPFPHTEFAMAACKPDGAELVRQEDEDGQPVARPSAGRR